MLPERFLTLVKPALKVTEQVNCELTHDLAKSPDLFYLLEGLALQGQAYDEDRQLVVPKLPGSVIGLEYLLTECNQPATRVTLAAPAKVGVINKAALRRLIDARHPIGKSNCTELLPKWLATTQLNSRK